MRSSILAVAASAALVSAGLHAPEPVPAPAPTDNYAAPPPAEEPTTTTTMTSTSTGYTTITKCADDVPDCPLKTESPKTSEVPPPPPPPPAVSTSSLPEPEPTPEEPKPEVPETTTSSSSTSTTPAPETVYPPKPEETTTPVETPVETPVYTPSSIVTSYVSNTYVPEQPTDDGDNSPVEPSAVPTPEQPEASEPPTAGAAGMAFNSGLLAAVLAVGFAAVY